MENPTVGYSLGIIEGYLETQAASGDETAGKVLEYLRIVEQAYKNKSDECFQHESKLEAIQLNLNGWKKI